MAEHVAEPVANPRARPPSNPVNIMSPPLPPDAVGAEGIDPSQVEEFVQEIVSPPEMPLLEAIRQGIIEKPPMIGWQQWTNYMASKNAATTNESYNR